MITQDHHVGHRDENTGDVLGSGWTQDDFMLFDAYQTIDDFSDQHGILVWDKESDRVDIWATHKVDKFESAKDRAAGKKGRKPIAGEYWVPDVRLIPGYEDEGWPTITEWRMNKLKAAGLIPDDA